MRWGPRHVGFRRSGIMVARRRPPLIERYCRAVGCHKNGAQWPSFWRSVSGGLAGRLDCRDLDEIACNCVETAGEFEVVQAAAFDRSARVDNAGVIA